MCSVLRLGTAALCAVLSAGTVLTLKCGMNEAHQQHRLNQHRDIFLSKHGFGPWRKFWGNVISS